MTIRIPPTRPARDFLTALDGLQQEHPDEPVHARDVEQFLGIDAFETALCVRELAQGGYLSVPSLIGEEGYFTEHTTEPLLFTKAGRAVVKGGPIPPRDDIPLPKLKPTASRPPRRRIRRRRTRGRTASDRTNPFTTTPAEGTT